MGIVFNFLFAALLFSVIFASQGTPTGEEHLTASRVDPNTPAQAAGWQPGDRIVRIGDSPIRNQDDFQNAIMAAAGKPVQVQVVRSGQTIATTFTPPIAHIAIASVSANTPAAVAGWQKGDAIVAINGQQIQSRDELSRAIDASAGQPVQIEILRNGQTIETTVTPRRNPPTGQGPLGVTIDTSLSASTGLAITITDVYKRESIWRAVPHGFGELFSGIGSIIGGLIGIVRGRVPGGVSNLTGPIGIGQVVNEVVKQATLPLWVVIGNLTAFISINLGILNLLPIPALDGGRLLFVIIEWVRRGKRVPPEREGLVHLIGMAVLLAIFVLVAFVDIQRILDGRSILPR
jgi:regulator of sigma E protease